MQVTAEMMRMRLTCALTCRGVAILPKSKESGSDEADQSEAANGAQLLGRTFYEDGVKRPAKCGNKGDEQSRQSNMSIVSAGLEPDYAERADQPKESADLELPLSDDMALFRKKSERE